MKKISKKKNQNEERIARGKGRREEVKERREKPRAWGGAGCRERS